MFDYKLLIALATVVEEGGFERAAHVLGLSQSAVSQRIKLLEARLGQSVIVRSVPPRATPVGVRLLRHIQQVRLLERDLGEQIPQMKEGPSLERLRIAINADSLATWWAAALGDFCSEEGVLLDLIVEDQDTGLRRMRAGEVAACVCASEQPVAGARRIGLGTMRYLGLASPGFWERHFAAGVDGQALCAAPAVVFGSDDLLQHRFLAAVGGGEALACHVCPSSEGFVRLMASGCGWGMAPDLQVREALARGELCELIPGTAIDVPLYWHHWRNGGRLLNALTQRIRHGAEKFLHRADREMNL